MRDSRKLGLSSLLGIAALALAAAAQAVPARVVSHVPEKDVAPDWGNGNRKRAQWKNETNKRGRNR